MAMVGDWGRGQGPGSSVGSAAAAGAKAAAKPKKKPVTTTRSAAQYRQAPAVPKPWSAATSGIGAGIKASKPSYSAPATGATAGATAGRGGLAAATGAAAGASATKTPVTGVRAGIKAGPSAAELAAKAAQQAAAAKAAAQAAAKAWVDKYGDRTETGSFDARQSAYGNALSHGIDSGMLSSALGSAGYTQGSKALADGTWDDKPAAVAAPEPTTETVTIPDAEADADYQRQVAELARQMADFQAQQNLANSQYDAATDQSLARMGWGKGGWSIDDRGAAYGGAYSDNLNDFAGRGLGRSSAFADSIGSINRDFNNRKTDIDRSAMEFDQTQDRAFQTYKGQNDQGRSNARAEAVARIAAKYGVDPGQVGWGSEKKITRPIGT